MAVERINEYINVENEVRRHEKSPRTKQRKRCGSLKRASSPGLEVTCVSIKVLLKVSLALTHPIS